MGSASFSMGICQQRAGKSFIFYYDISIEQVWILDYWGSDNCTKSMGRAIYVDDKSTASFAGDCNYATHTTIKAGCVQDSDPFESGAIIEQSFSIPAGECHYAGTDPDGSDIYAKITCYSNKKGKRALYSDSLCLTQLDITIVDAVGLSHCNTSTSFIEYIGVGPSYALSCHTDAVIDDSDVSAPRVCTSHAQCNDWYGPGFCKIVENEGYDDTEVGGCYNCDSCYTCSDGIDNTCGPYCPEGPVYEDTDCTSDVIPTAPPTSAPTSPRYIKVEEYYDWSTANQYCLDNFGGSLAIIRNEADQEAAAAACGSTYCWIGISYDPTLYGYYWQDGTDAVAGYSNWDVDEGDYGDCVEMNCYSDCTWNPYTCYYSQRFLCESGP